jgi:flagellar basal body-associated protein FliL
MSDKPAEKKAETPAAEGKEPAKAGGGLMSKTPVVLGAIMIVEAVVLFAGFKFLGAGAKNANAADLTTENKDKKDAKDGDASTPDNKKSVELSLIEFKAPNKVSGRTFLYDVAIFVRTKAEYETRVKDTIAGNGALIQDRVRTIIAQSDPEKLGGGSEPGLETLRRQVKYQLDEIVGEGIIDEVLIPRCIPYRADF